MDNCFVCDSYFYPIKNIPNNKTNSENDASNILDPSKISSFCESMDISPIPENVSETSLVPLCHKCTIASSKILLIQEQIMHLQNQVSQLQYSIAETALLTYYNNKTEEDEEDDGQADPETSLIILIRKLLRDRWEEQNDKSDTGDINSVESLTTTKEGNEDSNSMNENCHSSGNEDGNTPATKRPASFEWSQSIRKKNQLEPNILYVNLSQPNSNLVQDRVEDTITIEDTGEQEEEFIHHETNWEDMNSNGEYENAVYDDDDVIVEETSPPKMFQPINFINMANPISSGSSFVPEMPTLTPTDDFTMSSATSTRTRPAHLKTYSKISGSSSESDLVSTNAAAGDRRIRICPFEGCGKEFTNVDRFAEHINVHNGSGPSCDICQKVFPRKYNLRIHMRTHTGEKPHKCPICLQKYADKSNLNAHIRKHYEKPFHCSICRRMFDDISSAQSHIATFHPDRKERNLIRLTRLIPKVPT